MATGKGSQSEEGTVRMTVTIKRSTADKISELAADLHWSESAMASELLEEGLRHDELIMRIVAKIMKVVRKYQRRTAT